LHIILFKDKVFKLDSVDLSMDGYTI